MGEIKWNNLSVSMNMIHSLQSIASERIDKQIQWILLGIEEVLINIFQSL